MVGIGEGYTVRDLLADPDLGRFLLHINDQTSDHVPVSVKPTRKGLLTGADGGEGGGPIGKGEIVHEDILTVEVVTDTVQILHGVDAHPALGDGLLPLTLGEEGEVEHSPQGGDGGEDGEGHEADAQGGGQNSHQDAAAAPLAGGLGFICRGRGHGLGVEVSEGGKEPLGLLGLISFHGISPFRMDGYRLTPRSSKCARSLSRRRWRRTRTVPWRRPRPTAMASVGSPL